MTTVDRIAAALMLGYWSRSLLTRHARRYENVARAYGSVAAN